MKRTCDRCRALIESQGAPLECALGFKMDGEKGIPLEECPKPTRIGTFIALRSQQDASRKAADFFERLRQRRTNGNCHP